MPAPGYVMRFKTSAFRLGVPVTPVSVKYKTVLPLSWTTHHYLIAFFNHLANPFGLIEVKFFDEQTQREGESAQDFADRVGQMIADDLGYEYTHYQSQDWVYFGCGVGEDKITDEYRKDFGWMGTVNQFCKKHNIKTKNFGIRQKDVRHIKPQE